MIEPKTSIMELDDYVPPLGQRQGMARYDFNENVIGPSPRVIEALKKLDPQLLSTYPEYSNYYDSISADLGIDSSQILLTNGSDEAIKLVMETYMEEGDEVLLPEPTFSMYRFYADRQNLTIRSVLYNNDMSFPVNAVFDSISKDTKLIVLVNPNNPTGSQIPSYIIEEIVQKASDSLIIIDEAYYEFSGKTSIDLVNTQDNVIVLRTFSKALGLAGLRIGMAISNSITIGNLKKSSSPYNVSTIACFLASVAIEDKKFSQIFVESVRRSREEVSTQLQEWGYTVYPSSANFLLVDLGFANKSVIRFLRKAGILVRDRSEDPLLDNCIRITIGDRSDTEKLLSAIKRVRQMTPVILDMDGVLVDVSCSYIEAIRLTVERLTGKIPTNEEIQNLREEGGYNNDWKLSLELITREGFESTLEEVTSCFQEFYLGTSDQPGLVLEENWIADRNALERIRDKFPLFIFTERPRDETVATLKREGYLEFFDRIVTADDLPQGRGKPDPYGIQLITKGFASNNAYFFGDTVDDMQAAIAADATPIGIVCDPMDNAVILQNAGASRIIQIDQIEVIL